MDTEDFIMGFIFFMVIIMMTALFSAVGHDSNKKDANGNYLPVQYNCRVIPEAKRDKVAELMIECVNNATAKNTGENQDADDWVKACKEKVTEIYEVDGFRMGAVNNDGFDHYLTTCKELPDSLLTSAK
jgi:hypothetical protein